jgi:RND family efflux transporter MFP subunit
MKRASAPCALALLALLSACSKSDKPKDAVQAAAPKPETLAVKTAAAATRRVDKTISITGSLNPDETVNVSFEIAGRIAAIHTDFGQTVRKGDVLAELDKQEYQFQLERSKAALTQAYARLGIPAGQENATPESTAAMRQAQAQMDDSRSKFERAARLVKSGDISQERFVELEKAFHAREAAFEMTRDEMRGQLASIQSLRADIKLAQKRLNDTVVRAPFDGAVTQKMVSAGQYIKDNTTVLTLVKTNPMRLLADIPESEAGEIRIGTSLTFTTDAIPDRQFHAVVRQLNPSLDAKSRSLTAEARLTESDARLRPGMFVQVLLVTSRNAEVVVIPTDALYSVAGLTKAFVIRDGRAVEIQIPPGQVYEGWTQVPANTIRAGEMVAVSNLSVLINGSQVTTTVRAGL